MKTKTKFAVGALSAILFIVLIVLVLKVDVAPIGPEGTEIGLSHINEAVFSFTGTNMSFYSVTQVTGYLSLACGALFVAIGAKQLFTRKSLKRVDTEILVMGGLFAVTVLFYLLFDKVAVNYRPTLMPGETELETSFPSSHTLLACVMYGSILMVLKKYIKQPGLLRALKIACIALMVVTVLGRLASGAHWYTDIIGSLFLAGALLGFFAGVTDVLRKKKKAAKKAEKAVVKAEN